MTTTIEAMDTAAGRRVPLVDDTPLHDPALDRFGFAEFARALALLVDDDGDGDAADDRGQRAVGRWQELARLHGADDARAAGRAPRRGRPAARRAGSTRGSTTTRRTSARPLAPRPWRVRPIATGHGGGARSRRYRARCCGRASARARPCCSPSPARGSRSLVALFGPSRDLTAVPLLGDPERPGDRRRRARRRLLRALRRRGGCSRPPARRRGSSTTRGRRPRTAACPRSGTSSARLIGHATHDGRLVIIVDDLERCASDRALEVCQVASQLLGQPGVVTDRARGHGADRPVGRRALRGRRCPAAQVEDPEEIGRRYLAKIVQLEIALPRPRPDDMRRVIREYGPSLRHAQAGRRRRPRRGACAAGRRS